MIICLGADIFDYKQSVISSQYLNAGVTAMKYSIWYYVYMS